MTQSGTAEGRSAYNACQSDMQALRSIAAPAQPPLPGRTRHVSVVLLVLAALSWGAATVLSKVALNQLAPLDLFGIEVLVGFLPLLAFPSVRMALRHPNPKLLLLGVLEPGLSYALFDFGTRLTSASHAALLIATEGPFTLVLAVALLRERPRAWVIAAFITAGSGSALISGSGGGGSSVAGDILVVASAAAAAGFAVLARHVAADGRDVLVVTAVQMLGATLVALPVGAVGVLAGTSHVASADASHLTAAGAVGLLSGMVPFLLFHTAVAHVTATRAALVLTLIPVFGAAGAIAFLHDPFTIAAAVGGALAIGAATFAAVREPG